MPVKKQKIQIAELVHGIKPYAMRKTEKFMGKKMQGHFRGVLGAWKNELTSEIDKTVQELRSEHENHPDPNDRASQETDISLELRSRDRESKLIKKIDEAVGRINSGDYGYCENCGEDIGVQRLEARPTADLCIDCKTLAEIREKQMN